MFVRDSLPCDAPRPLTRSLARFLPWGGRENGTVAGGLVETRRCSNGSTVRGRLFWLFVVLKKRKQKNPTADTVGKCSESFHWGSYWWWWWSIRFRPERMDPRNRKTWGNKMGCPSHIVISLSGPAPQRMRLGTRFVIIIIYGHGSRPGSQNKALGGCDVHAISFFSCGRIESRRDSTTPATHTIVAVAVAVMVVVVVAKTPTWEECLHYQTCEDVISHVLSPPPPKSGMQIIVTTKRTRHRQPRP